MTRASAASIPEESTMVLRREEGTMPADLPPSAESEVELLHVASNTLPRPRRLKKAATAPPPFSREFVRQSSACSLSDEIGRTRFSERVSGHFANPLKSVLPDPGTREGSIVTEAPTLCEREPFLNVRAYVESATFDAAICVCVFSNAIVIGVQTDYSVRHVGERIPNAFKVAEAVFCVVFTLELVCRMIAYRLDFFMQSGRGWNVFDTVVVILQLLDMTLQHDPASDEGSNTKSDLVSFVSILRILRFARLALIVRVLRYSSELRTMLTLILSSCRALLWTLALVFFFIYVVSVYLTNLVANHGEIVDNAVVQEYYGSLLTTIFSLFRAVTGGVTWGDLVKPLMEEISPYIGFVFVLYIGFVVLCIMNVVTGVFVETSLRRAEADKESGFLRLLESSFQKADVDGNGTITSDEFLCAFSENSFAESMNVGPSDAAAIFDLLDVDESGEVDIEEFVLGCLRIRGECRGLDMASLMYFNKRIAAWWAERLDAVDEALGSISYLIRANLSTAGGSLAGRCWNNKKRKHSNIRSSIVTWSDIRKVGKQRVREIRATEARKKRYYHGDKEPKWSRFIRFMDKFRWRLDP